MTSIPRIELAVLDMGGTTIDEAGAVEDSFAAGIDTTGIANGAQQRAEMLDYVRRTMGRSKIDVFTHLADGNEQTARAANETFEAHLRGLLRAGRITPIPGAAEAIQSLRTAGIKVALATGFSHEIQYLILEYLGWNDLVDLALTREEAGRGRPFPDMPLTALLQARVTGVQNLLVGGDTVADIVSGVRAGAAMVVGVETGTTHTADQLWEAGATQVVPSVADLPALLEIA